MPERRWDVLTRLIREHGYGVGAEVGILRGRMLNELLTDNPGLRMYAVDIESTPEAERVFRFHRARVIPLRGDSVEMASKVADGGLDFAFIDADHSEAAVRADIEAWRPKIRRGGMLMGHDYDHKRHIGVKPAVDGIFDRVTAHDDFVWTVEL